MGRILHQVFSGITAALGKSLGFSHSIFDSVRSCGFQALGFVSHFRQLLSNVHGFSEESGFLILFHTESSISSVAAKIKFNKRTGLALDAYDATMRKRKRVKSAVSSCLPKACRRRLAGFGLALPHPMPTLAGVRVRSDNTFTTE